MKETWHYDYQECLKLKLKNQVEMISHRFNFPLRSFPKRKLRRPEEEASISSWSVAEYAPKPPVLMWKKIHFSGLQNMYGFLQVIVGVKPWRPAYSSHTQTPEEIIFTIAIFITSSNSSILLVSALALQGPCLLLHFVQHFARKFQIELRTG